MALCKSKMVLCIAVYVLGIILFAEGQYAVNRKIIVANARENVTLRCFTHTRYSTYSYWVRDNRYSIAAVNVNYPKGWFYDGRRFTQSYGVEISNGLFELYIYNARAESGTYTCLYGTSDIQKYDVRVIGCPTCFLNLLASHGLEQPRLDVNCHLNNFRTAEPIPLLITMNRNRTNKAIVEGNSLTFNISNPMIYGTIRVEFNPFTDTRSNIVCIVPAQLTTPQSYTLDELSPSTSLMTTSPTSPSTTSAKSSATKSEITSDSETTSAAITTTGAKPHDSMQKSSSSPIMYTSYLTSGTTTSTGNQTRKNINPGTENNTKNNGITIIIIIILGAILMIVVVVIIFVLRLKKRRNRQQGRRIEGKINAAVREQDTCYESIGGSSGIRDGELINNVLYESSDQIIQSSILRSGDEQLDTALYTIPDKTGMLKRVAKSGVASVSSHGNSSMNRHQHEQKEFKQVGPGDDDDTNIPLYAMPDKGPRSTRKSRKTSPGSVSTEDDADIPLYALPDKRPGSKGNMKKATPGPGTRNEGDEIPLYAVLNKEPGSKDNRPTVKPKPGDQSKALNKDNTRALYAEVDKSN